LRMRDLLFPFLRASARVRSRRFDHVITLGYNCELAARFFQCFKFVDATLFSWVAVPSAEEMAYAIRHVDEIFNGKVEPPRRDFPLFRCANTNLRAHGRSKMSVWTAEVPPSKEFVDAELTDLVSRFRHMREKTLDYLRDDKTVLAVLKVNPADCVPGRANEAVMLHVKALRDIGARNMTFLAVCEQAKARAFEHPHPDFELRTVAEYSPEGHAADLKRGDPRGWKLVFEEFRPRTLKKQAHKFKFEDDDGH